ncbi:MAG: hypothetical protein EZS28_024689 [Streblomastix strix]|uniref:Uncharacterized protein n=1 Tax=Streblomastix strix TaxID=222440 RepID=A0A5J4VBN8_9EUKA|nr:MAG: hypothetical protein EZS28_024689 [Streblomastix strix]
MDASVTDEQCVPDKGLIGDQCKEQCKKGDDIPYYLRDMKIMRTNEPLTEELMKILIYRFGPVLVFGEENTRGYIYYGWHIDKQGATCFQALDRNSNNILQWEDQCNKNFELISEIFYAYGNRGQLDQYSGDNIQQVKWNAIFVVILLSLFALFL